MFVSHENGIDIFRQQGASYEKVGRIEASLIDGVAHRMYVEGDKLWLIQRNEHRVISIDMRDSEYSVTDRFDTLAADGSPLAASDLIVSGDLYLVATGENATVQAYVASGDHSAELAGAVGLEFLIPSGDLDAYRLQLRGQILYVAAQEGDIQLFNISDWLQGDFSTEPELEYYYSVLGNATGVAAEPHAIYAGTAFGLISGSREVENPVNEGLLGVSGQVATIENELFVVVDQTPDVSGVLLQGQPLSITFNRVVNQRVLSDVIRLTASGQDQAFSVDVSVTNGQSRVTITPDFGYENLTQYEVSVSETLSDISGNTLKGRYNFRFTYLDRPEPVLEKTGTEFISWRGGETLDLYGEGFYAGMKVFIGNVEIPAENIEFVSATHIRITMPQFPDASVNNDLVAITLGDENHRNSYLAQVNIVANPVIEHIGRFNVSRRQLEISEKVLGFNRGQKIGIRGTGLGPFTDIRINNRPATGIEQISDNLIAFDQPTNTLGQMKVAVRNGNSEVFTNSDMSSELIPATYLRSTDDVARSGNLLFVRNRYTISVYSTSESERPEFISSVSLPVPERGESPDSRYARMAVSGSYLYVLLENTHNLHVYSIENAYAPELVNSINSAKQYAFDQLEAVGDIVVARQGSTLYVTNANGNDWKEVSSQVVAPESVIDMAAYDKQLLVLTSGRLIRYLLQGSDLTEDLSGIHNVNSPESLEYHHGLAVIQASDSLSAYNVSDAISLIGRENNIHVDRMALHGEILMVSMGSSFSVMDVNIDEEGGDPDNRFSLNKVTGFNGSRSIHELMISDGLIEWWDSSYANVRLPALLLTPAERTLITNANGYVEFHVSENHENLSQAAFSVRERRASSDLNGSARPVNRSLVFETFTNDIQAASVYEARVVNTYEQYVDGLNVENDRVYRYVTPAVLDADNAEVYQVSPNIALNDGVAHTFTITGQNLDADGLILEIQGNEIVESAITDISSDRLTFSYVPDSVGYKSLKWTVNGQSGVIPVAINIVSPVQITDVASDAASGRDKLSDVGGDRITVTATGISPDIQVYWMPAGPGFVLENQYLVKHELSSAAGQSHISFTVPSRDRAYAYQPGSTYQAVIVRARTGDESGAEEARSALLTIEDKTRPVVRLTQSYYYSRGLRLESDEPLNVENLNYTVTQYKCLTPGSCVGNLTSGTVLDADNFVLQANTDKQIIEIRNSDDYFAEHNSIYRFDIQGITDLQNNPANVYSYVNGRTPTDGMLVAEFEMLDRIPPGGLRILNNGSDISDSPLTTGSEYNCLVPSASDNMDANIRYSYRISHDGFTYSSWITPQYGCIRTSIAFGQRALNIILRAADDNQASEELIEVALREPDIDLSEFTVTPSQVVSSDDYPEVEEVQSSSFRFGITGDTNLIKTADRDPAASKPRVEVNLYGRWVALDTTLERVAGSGGAQDTVVVSVSEFIQPRIDDLVASSETHVDIKVRVRVPFGLGGTKDFERTYRLVEDRTNPEVHIVTPENNSFVPWGEALDLYVNAFDRNGVERVEASLQFDGQEAGEWVLLEQPNNHTFPASEMQKPESNVPQTITVRVRATDLNGNPDYSNFDYENDTTGSVAQLTLVPYDPDEGEPVLEFAGPADGSMYHGKTSVPLLIKAANISGYEIRVLKGGTELDDDLTVASDEIYLGEETFIQEIKLPEVSVDQGVVIKLLTQRNGVATELDQLFLNVKADNSVGTRAIIRSVPDAAVLAGTELMYRADAESVIDDMSDDSSVGIVGQTQEYAFGEWNASATPIVNDHTGSLEISAALRDNSGNSAVETKRIGVMPFFTDTDRTENETAFSLSEESIAGLGYSDLSGFVLVVNKLLGGYRVIDAENGENYLEQNGSGTIRAVFSDNNYLYLENEASGNNELIMLKQGENNQYSTSETYAFEGDAVGVNGNLLFARIGNSVVAYVLSQESGKGQLLAVSYDNIRDVVLHHNKLWVLTDRILESLVPALEGGMMTLRRDQRFVMENYDQVHVSDSGIALIRNNTVSVYRNDGASLSSAELPENITAIRSFAGGWWLRAGQQGDAYTWFAIRGGNIVARLTAGSDIAVEDQQFVSVGAGKSWVRNIYNGNGSAVITEPENSADVSVLSGPTGYTVTLNNASGTAIDTTAYAKAGESSVMLYQLGAASWHVPYAAEGPLRSIVLHYRNDLRQGQIEIALSDPGNAQAANAVSVVPSVSDRAENSVLPVVVVPEDHQKAGMIRINNTDLLPVIDLGWMFITEAGSDIADTVISVNNNGNITREWNIKNNEPAGRINITAPLNNQEFTENSYLNVRYSCEINHNVRFSRVTLEDTNNVVLKEILVDGCRGNLDLDTPDLQLSGNYNVRVRAFFGDHNDYTDSSVAIRILPEVKPVSADLAVAPYVVAGARLSIKRPDQYVSEISNIVIRAFSETGSGGNILVSGENSAETVIPSGENAPEYLTVSSYISDGNGNTDEKQYRIHVLTPFVLSEAADTSAYTAIRTGVASGLIARGNTLYNDKGQLLLTLESDILQVDRLGLRIMLLTADGIEIFDPALNYQRVAYHTRKSMRVSTRYDSGSPLQDMIHNGHMLWGCN